jgi:transcriptional regulator with XRE-family HTH domain
VSTPQPADRHAASSATLGSWLRAQRLARGWPIAEMARRLCTAAKAADDYTIETASIMTTYVRRWERGKIAPTERYQLHYCTVLGLAPNQFGPAPPPCSTTHPSEPASPPSVHDRDGGSVVVVIPDNCLHVTIHIHPSGTAGTPTQPDSTSHSSDQTRDQADNGHHQAGPAPPCS